ncbi:hypothetical protein PshuTeo1_50430 [Pseudomonas hunanensis]|nr:hypothetical protein PshuTeo1_50430 [Pseudomonas hunanensis]
MQFQKSISAQMGIFTLWWGWSMLLGATTLFVLIGLFAHFHVLDQESSGWVQAIGSIAAIFTAVVIANRQGEQQIQAQRTKDQVMMSLVTGVATRAAAASHALFVGFDGLEKQNKETNEEILTAIESQVLALRGINPADLPKPEMVEPFLKLRAIMEQKHVMAGLLANGRVGYVDKLRCATVFAHNSQAANVAACELQRLAQA